MSVSAKFQICNTFLSKDWLFREVVCIAVIHMYKTEPDGWLQKWFYLYQKDIQETFSNDLGFWENTHFCGSTLHGFQIQSVQYILLKQVM